MPWSASANYSILLLVRSQVPVSSGSQLALSTLLRLNTAEVLVGSIAQFDPASDPLTLKSAYARALRALIASVADVVGPSEYGLRPEYNSELRGRAREVLDLLFSVSYNFLDQELPTLEIRR